MRLPQSIKAKPAIPVGKPYKAPPKKSGGWLRKGLLIVLFMAICAAIGAFVLPKFINRADNTPIAQNTPKTDPNEGKSAYQLAMEEADGAQEQAEMEMAAKGGAEYTGVNTPDKLDDYKVVVPDEPKETKPVSRPAQEVVVPQLPMGTAAADVAVEVDKDIKK